MANTPLIAFPALIGVAAKAWYSRRYRRRRKSVAQPPPAVFWRMARAMFFAGVDFRGGPLWVVGFAGRGPGGGEMGVIALVEGDEFDVAGLW